MQVCPTGIDIRNGLQYQCIGCAHCIDACDDVMDKVGYAPGLIRLHDRTTALAAGSTAQVLRPRVIGYARALSAMVVAVRVVLLHRTCVGIDVMRDRGELFHATATRFATTTR